MTHSIKVTTTLN